MLERKKIIYALALLCFSIVTLTFRPGLWLTHKPASDQNIYYVKGWQDGCISGTNSYSLLYAPMLEKPFIKELEMASASAESSGASTAKDNYKSGWNEGFTLCRFYQASVYELMQFAIIIATLLFIGYLLSKKRV